MWGGGGGDNPDSNGDRGLTSPGGGGGRQVVEGERGFWHDAMGVLFSSAAGDAYWPITIRCPSLGPFPSIGGGAHRPLTTLCPSSSSLAYPSLSPSLSLPLGERGMATAQMVFPNTVKFGGFPPSRGEGEGEGEGPCALRRLPDRRPQTLLAISTHPPSLLPPSLPPLRFPLCSPSSTLSLRCLVYPPFPLPAATSLQGGWVGGALGGTLPPAGDPELLEAPKAPKKFFGLN